MTARRQSRLQRRVDRFFSRGQPSDLEGLLAELVEGVRGARGRLDGLETELGSQKVLLERSLGRFALERYNAFPGVGAQLSFSLAALSLKGDGFLLTALFGREETRVYAKAVSSGRAEQVLSEEEQRVLDRAMQS